MLEAAVDGLLGILAWRAFALMLFGIVISTTLVAMPGIGSKTAIALLLPVAFVLDTFEAVALIVSIWAVSNTGNSITSILFGVPGGGGSQATIMEGYPMARKGEAPRALTASFVSSAIGGVLGALVLLAAIPVLRPLVLILGPPEFFALIVLGVSMIGALSGKQPVKGIVVGLMGLGLTAIGVQHTTGLSRYTFTEGLNTLYLIDGIGLVPMALGLFAIPEMLAMVAMGGISGVPLGNLRAGMAQGFRDNLRHWWLLLRTSVIGVVVGIIPGLGASVADWFAYGHARQTCAGSSETFTRGDVRGVIGVDAATNAKEGGSLIPTLAFGIPGSSTLALIFGGLVIVGVTPGREMLTDRLDVTMSMIWLLIIASVITSAFCLAFTPQLARLTRMRPVLLAPLIMALAGIGSFAASNRFEDVLSMLAFGVLGYLMRQAGWPRPPMLIGLVLGGLAERHLTTSLQLYGAAFLARPATLVILAVAAAGVMYPIWQERRRRRTTVGAPGGSR